VVVVTIVASFETLYLTMYFVVALPPSSGLGLTETFRTPELDIRMFTFVNGIGDHVFFHNNFEHPNELQALAATCLELVRAANKTSVFGSIVPWQASPRP
jgi:hypothetical protein